MILPENMEERASNWQARASSRWQAVGGKRLVASGWWQAVGKGRRRVHPRGICLTLSGG
jgi:hypothetical protein